MLANTHIDPSVQVVYNSALIQYNGAIMPTYAVNKKARHDYEILNSIEAGLMLSGNEVKAIRSGLMKLTGAYVTFHKNEAFLTGAHIGKYKQASNLEGYDPMQSRKLLLKRRQIDDLHGKLAEKGLTIVPLSVYTKGRHIKVEVGLGKGKKLHDKRRTLKKRDLDRQAQRLMKN